VAPRPTRENREVRRVRFAEGRRAGPAPDLDTPEAVRAREIEPALPPGVKIVSTYDRSDLILRSIATLKEKLIEESLIVSLVIIIFLFHVRSALVAIITLPIAIILSFIAIYYLNLTSS